MVFNLRKGLKAHQSNHWLLEFFNVDQGDNQQRFNGSVRGTNPSNPAMNGQGSCEISPGVGGQFRLTANWDGGGSSLYIGTFGLGGQLTGVTFAPSDPAHQATWFSEETYQQF